MKALIVSSEFPPGPGGIGNHAHQLALNLHRLGWEIAVVSPQDYVSVEAVEKFNSAQPFGVYRMPSGGVRALAGFQRLRTVMGTVRKFRPDILIGTGLSGVWVAAVAGMVHGLRVAAVAHGSEFGKGTALSRVVNRLAFHRMAVVIAVSQFTKGVVNKAGIMPRRMEVITNGADHRRFYILPESERRAFREQSGVTGANVLLTVGHVSERKGQEVVIRALPHILKKSPNTQYFMIGLPTLKPKLTQIAGELGVQDQIHFLGTIASEDMIKWLNCCDIFLMTSRTTADGDCEGFGIAAVEAALCGKPAVVSAQSGLIEAIQDGVSGIGVAEGDHVATADAVISLLTNVERREAMGQAANTRALKSQTWEPCAARYDVVLRSVIDRPLPQASPQLQD